MSYPVHRNTATSNTITVTDETFHDVVLASDSPVLVDFWAEWCPPCHAIAPILDQLAMEYFDRLKVVKVDVDASPRATLACGVQAMPTLALFHGGQMVARMVGARPKSRLVKEIDDFLTQVITPTGSAPS
jgi:thioredoxin 1